MQTDSKADQPGDENAASDVFHSAELRRQKLQHKSYILWRPHCHARGAGVRDPAPPPFSQYVQEEIICLSETFSVETQARSRTARRRRRP